MLDAVDVRDLLTIDHIQAVSRIAEKLAENRPTGAIAVTGHDLPAELFTPAAGGAPLRDFMRSRGAAGLPVHASSLRRLNHLFAALLPSFGRVLFSDRHAARNWMVQQSRATGALGDLLSGRRHNANQGLLTLCLLPAGETVDLSVEGRTGAVAPASQDRVVLAFGAQLARMFGGFSASTLVAREADTDRTEGRSILVYSFGEARQSRPAGALHPAFRGARQNTKVWNGYPV